MDHRSQQVVQRESRRSTSWRTMTTPGAVTPPRSRLRCTASSLKSASSRFRNCRTTVMFQIGLKRAALRHCCLSALRQRKRHRRAMTTRWSVPPTSDPRAMDWLWRGHILRGSLELLTGLPGMGKSQVHCQFVASVTTGRAWPDGTNGITARNVIMLTAEDCLDQTIIPRLTAAKAKSRPRFHPQKDPQGR